MNVYIFRAGPFFKIGKSNDIEFRIQVLQTGCPYPIECAARLTSESPFVIEKQIHKALSNQRVSGEWFFMSSGCFDELTTKFGFTVLSPSSTWTTFDHTVDAFTGEFESRLLALDKKYQDEVERLKLSLAKQNIQIQKLKEKTGDVKKGRAWDQESMRLKEQACKLHKAACVSDWKSSQTNEALLLVIRAAFRLPTCSWWGIRKQINFDLNRHGLCWLTDQRSA